MTCQWSRSTDTETLKQYIRLTNLNNQLRNSVPYFISSKECIQRQVIGWKSEINKRWVNDKWTLSNCVRLYLTFRCRRQAQGCCAGCFEQAGNMRLFQSKILQRLLSQCYHNQMHSVISFWLLRCKIVNYLNIVEIFGDTSMLSVTWTNARIIQI
jgi:hypothetical protein